MVRIALTEMVLLECLVLRVRGFTIDQVTTLLGCGRRQAATRMRSFAREGLIEVKRLFLRPTPPIDGPVSSWYPGQPVPAAGPTSYRSRRRWQTPAAAPRLTTVYVASRRTVARFGGRKRPRIKDATHDLGLSQTFIHFWQERGDLWTQWVNEDNYDHELMAPKVPDALLIDRDGVVRLIADFSGSYRRARVQDLLRLALCMDVPIELY